MSIELLKLLVAALDGTLGASKVEKMLREFQTERACDLELQYYALMQSFSVDTSPALNQKLKSGCNPKRIVDFSDLILKILMDLMEEPPVIACCWFFLSTGGICIYICM